MKFIAADGLSRTLDIVTLDTYVQPHRETIYYHEHWPETSHNNFSCVFYELDVFSK